MLEWASQKGAHRIMPFAPEARVAVIVVTWNSAAVIEGLVRSVREAEIMGSLRLIVVDNASGDASTELVRAIMPEADIVHMGRNAGYAAGINAGLALAADCEAFLLLNPDIRLERDTVARLLDEMRDTGAGIVVPRLVDASGGLRLSLRREPTVLRAWGESLLGGRFAGRYPSLGEMEVRAEVYDRRVPAEWATGAAMMISRRCLARVGPWDETFFLYSEETDFALRARDAGFRLRYTPRAVAVHFEGESHASPALFSLLTRNRVKLFRSRHGLAATSLFWFGVIVGECLRAARPTRRAAVRALLGLRRGVAQPTS